MDGPSGGARRVPPGRALHLPGRSAPGHSRRHRVRDPGVPAPPGGGAGRARPRAREGRGPRPPAARGEPALDRDAGRGRADALVRLRGRVSPRLALHPHEPRDRSRVRRPAGRGGRSLEGPHRRLHQGLPLRDRRNAPALRALRPPFLRPGQGVAPDGEPARLGLEPPPQPPSRLRPRQPAGRDRLRGDPQRRRLPRGRLRRRLAVRARRVGRLQRHRRRRRAPGHGRRPACLQRRPRPRAPDRPLHGRRRHLAPRPALSRPLRLDLAGVRGGGPRPHGPGGRLSPPRPGADEPHRLHPDRRERVEPTGLRLPRRRGRRGRRHRLAEDDGGVREGGPRQRPVLRPAGRHPLLLGLRLPRRLALPPGGGHPPRPSSRARRVLDVLAAIQQGLLAPDRPHRRGPDPRTDRGPSEGGRLRRRDHQPLRLLPAARPGDRAPGQADHRPGERQGGVSRRAEGQRAELRRRQGIVEVDRAVEGPGPGAARSSRGRVPVPQPRAVRAPRVRLRHARGRCDHRRFQGGSRDAGRTGDRTCARSGASWRTRKSPPT